MSSREIAELTGKRQADVMRDIRVILADLEITERKFASSYFDSTGRELPCFNLPKRETMILVSGYSVVLRARIVERWMELQEAAAICMEVMQIGHLVSAQFSADWSDALGIVGGPPKIP